MSQIPLLGHPHQSADFLQNLGRVFKPNHLLFPTRAFVYTVSLPSSHLLESFKVQYKCLFLGRLPDFHTPTHHIQILSRFRTVALTVSFFALRFLSSSITPTVILLSFPSDETWVVFNTLSSVVSSLG